MVYEDTGLDIASMTWNIDEPGKIHSLINDMKKDEYGMFEGAIFLHETSLMPVFPGGFVPASPPGHELGKLMLENTSLPEMFEDKSGMLVVVLDPFRWIEDEDRTDNSEDI